MEQLVARRAHNPKVVGSSPAPATKQVKSLESKVSGFFCFAASGSTHRAQIRQLTDVRPSPTPATKTKPQLKT